jgi:argininosuccinate lyase
MSSAPSPQTSPQAPSPESGQDSAPAEHRSALHAKQDAWSGRFAEPVADFVLRYTASVDFDQRLALADIRGSLAHARMLGEAGVLAAADVEAIGSGLARIREEIVAGRFAWRLDLEDVHLNIEARLTELVGDAGKRLHTGRSRNDQVATDVRLYLREEIDARCTEVARLQRRCTPTPSCRASPTCRWPSPWSSATTCWPMWKCSNVTRAACATRAHA